MNRHLRRGFVIAVVLPALLTASACRQDSSLSRSLDHAIIPLPTEVSFAATPGFSVTDETTIVFDRGDAEAERVAWMLADLIGNTVDTTPPVNAIDGSPAPSNIYFTRNNADADLGSEGYHLSVLEAGITVRAQGDAGLFYGMQTIRQLFPALVEYTAAYPNPLEIRAMEVVDAPRFEWRGVMLDVSRHFLPPRDVKRFVDLMSLYKMNRLHLHLADDQGWRIEIPGRPRLTEVGSKTQVGGKGGGFYTTEEYADIVRYAEERFVTVVPEIDLPGHTNAALASYAELNCDGRARPTYTGTNVGFSSVCVAREETYQFIDDVIGGIAAMTPGAYFHVGGDEVETLTEEEYIAFVERVQTIVKKHGKRLVGWDEVSAARLERGSRVQLWRPLWPTGGDVANLDSSRAAAATALRRRIEASIGAGVQFIASPADRIYLDMKYDAATTIGLSWAGITNVRHAYDWDISDVFSGIPESAIAGVEATLWSESFGTVHDFEYMAFPRLPGVAELGWSIASARKWDDYRHRLAAHEKRWKILGVNYHRSGLIPWTVGDG